MQVDEPENELSTQLGSDPPANDPAPQTETSEPTEGMEAENGDEGQQQPQDADTSTPDEQAKARAQGWRPKNEWRGDPRAWIPASEFLVRGEQIMPILRSRAERAERNVSEMQQRIERMEREQTERLRRLENVSRVALQEQARQLANHYEGLRRQAVERGDVEAYDQVSQQYSQALGDLNTRAAAAEAVPPQQEEQPQRDPETDRAVRDWIGQQDWWSRDKEMTEEAINYHGYLLQTKPWMSVERNLEATEAYLRGQFPDRYQGGQPARQNGNGARPNAQTQQSRQPAHAAVEGGGRLPGGGPRAKGWADIPAEDKRSAESFIRNDGLFLPDGANPEKLSEQDINKARANYARAYFEQG